MAHEHGPHIRDFDGHVMAVESDVEYFRTKRFEPRVLHLIRRGVVTLYDLMRAAEGLQRQPPAQPPDDLEQRIRALEDRLDEFIIGIAVTGLPLRTARVVIEDTRKERGDYDAFFRIAKRSHEDELVDRVAQLERELDDCLHLLHIFARALVLVGETDEEQLAAQREELRSQGHRNGARIVARAWVDPDFKQRLLTEGREAVRELDIPPGRLGKLGIAENTDDVHNVVVCTLCSCYPHDLLGNPPWWYRTDEYKERIVRDPRSTLKQMFDLDVPPGMRIHVHDSTSDVRWMVLPQRPPGTDDMSEGELAHLVTPESLVGTAPATSPAQPAGRGR
jgi:nitrile hydratase subunit alpha